VETGTLWLSKLMNDVQKDNVANQREHLILLLANVHIRKTTKHEPLPKVLYVPLNLIVFDATLRHFLSQGY